MPKGIYKIELNEKIYVGSSSISIKGRWKSHLSGLRKGTHGNIHLQNAYNKHGELALKFSILEVVEIAEDVIILEQKYIDELKPEFNICKIAGSKLGCAMSEKAKVKMSLVALGRKHSEETRLKIGLASKSNQYGIGNKHTEEAKLKIGLASKGNAYAKGRKMSEEQKTNISLVHKGKKLSEETKEKLRQTSLKYWRNH